MNLHEGCVAHDVQIISGLLPRPPPQLQRGSVSCQLPLPGLPTRHQERSGRGRSGPLCSQRAALTSGHRRAALASVRPPFLGPDKSEMTRVCVTVALFAEGESDFLAKSAARCLAVQSRFPQFPCESLCSGCSPETFQFNLESRLLRHLQILDGTRSQVCPGPGCQCSRHGAGRPAAPRPGTPAGDGSCGSWGRGRGRGRVDGAR